jgi:hypothetical protein
MSFTEKEFNKFTEDERMNRVLRGIAYFPFIQRHKHSDKYGTDEYSVNLVVTGEELKKAKSWGLEIMPATDKIPGEHVVIKRAVRYNKDQTPESVKPLLVDDSNQEITTDQHIGNGSELIIKFGTYFFNKVRTTMFKVKLVKLVPYARKDDMPTDGTGYKVAVGDNVAFDN